MSTEPAAEAAPAVAAEPAAPRTPGHVVGLDIGDGESCIAWVTTGGTEPATVFTRTTGERSIVTAMAIGPDRRRVIGESALVTPEAVQFAINFKQRPDDGGVTPDTVLFAQVLLAEFSSAEPEVAEDCVVYVGHPTGWSPDDVAVYREQLAALRYPVELVSESHSALLHVRDRATPETPVPARALVIDIGSSTTDVTFVEDLVPHNLPVGADLGGRLIDQELARRTRQALAGDASLQQALETTSGQNFLLLACRRAKESHFGSTRRGILDLREAYDDRYLPIVSSAWPWLKSYDIPAMVAEPDGWARRFAALLDEVRGKLGPDREPELVVLTGGGSRMAFVERLCTAAFPDATVDHDPDPTFAVARGLASNGRHRARVVAFRQAITTLLDGREFRRSVTDVVTTTMAGLAEELAEDAEWEIEHQELMKDLKPRPEKGGEPPTGPEESIVLDHQAMGDRAAATAAETLAGMSASMGEVLLPQVSDICRSHGIDGRSVLVDIAVPPEVQDRLSQLVSRFATTVVALDRTRKVSRFLGDASARVAMNRQQSRNLKQTQGGYPNQQGGASQFELAATAFAFAATYGTSGAARALTWGAKKRLKAKLRSTITSPAETAEIVEQVLRSVKADVHARAEVVERYLQS